MMAAPSVGHVGLNVTDLARSRAFYAELLGLSVVAESEREGRRFALLGRGSDILVTLWQQADSAFAASGSGLHHLSFGVGSLDEVREIERRARRLGAPFLYQGVVPHAEGMDSGGVYFSDPDGIRLEVFAGAGAGTFAAPHADGPSCGLF
jgi:catechol 2,3-dioxygenase-like lactoylglutathione lyase family enzyme